MSASEPTADAPEPTVAVPAGVLAAARQVLAAEGPAAATLERIATAAGISRMTLHRRGVTRPDILRALAARLEAEHREAMWTALVATGTACDRLRLALELDCAVTERNLALLDALDDAARHAIFHQGAPDGLTRGVFVDPLKRLLLDGAADGTLTVEDPRETATVLFNAVGHTYRHLRGGHGWSPERARTGVLALVLQGLETARS